MGYACPVCEIPQADGEHLAHHLAFTALLHEDAHEAWLDEHVPNWETNDPEDLIPELTDRVTETEYPEVFEDTTDTHDHPRADKPPMDPSGIAGELDADAEAIIEEARRLTEEKYRETQDE